MEDPVDGLIATRFLSQAKVDQFGNHVVDGVKLEFRTLHQTGVMAVKPNLAAPTPNVIKLTFFDADMNWKPFKWLMMRVTANFDVSNLETIQNGPLPAFEVQLRDLDGGSATLDQSHFSPPMTRPVLHELYEETQGSGGTTQTTITNATALAMTTVRVALTAFQGVNLERMSILEIFPAPNFPNHMFFDDFQLAKEP
jgi:hypothetical protein